MSVSELWRLCAVKIGETTIGQITDEELSDEITEFLTRDSAAVYNRSSGVDLEDVRIRFTTEAIKTALNTIGLTGVDLSANNAVAYFAQYEKGGGIKANACATFTFALGLGVWRSLAAGQGQLTNATFELIGLSSDGATHPAQKSTGVAVPTIATKEK